MKGVTDRAKLQISRRKMLDRSFVMVMVGAACMLPPLADISLAGGSVAGIPFPVVYIFGVWLALIVGAAALARPLLDGDEAGFSNPKD